jgi:Tfp pilus assembly protein PilZ
MRSVPVQFPSGREVLSSYWGFLEHGGLVLRDSKDLREGDAVVLEVRIKSLKQSYRFAGRVVKRSSDEKRTFVAFDKGQDQQQMLNAAWADTHDVPQRKHQRYMMGGGEALYGLGDAPSSMTRGEILDVSSGGCRLKGPVAFPVGARLKLATLGIEMTGQVRWVTPGREMGIEFIKPEREALQSLLSKAG